MCISRPARSPSLASTSILCFDNNTPPKPPLLRRNRTIRHQQSMGALPLGPLKRTDTTRRSSCFSSLGSAPHPLLRCPASLSIHSLCHLLQEAGSSERQRPLSHPEQDSAAPLQQLLQARGRLAASRAQVASYWVSYGREQFQAATVPCQTQCAVFHPYFRNSSLPLSPLEQVAESPDTQGVSCSSQVSVV